MHFKVITPVGVEPVSLDEARLQCRIDPDDTTHDDALTGLITAAREFAEHATGELLAPREVEAAMDGFPAADSFDLPMSPVTELLSVSYTDGAGVELALPVGHCELSPYGESRTVLLGYGKSWPAARASRNSVRVRFKCGRGAEEGAEVPLAAKQAMLIHIELESALVPLQPLERQTTERARDSLLNTFKRWGR